MITESNKSRTLPVRALLLALLLIPALADAQVATQRVDLVSGWNAVWLEVEPTYPAGHPRADFPKAPEDAFNTAANTQISVIASPRQIAGVAEFFATDPTSETGVFNQDGWEQWLRTDPADVSDLVMTTGNRAYLIRTDAAVTVDVTGKARFSRPTWNPDRYNLIGFGTDGSISFEEFFAPGGEAGGRHPVGIGGDPVRIFALDPAGNWAPVTPGDAVGNDIAYWVFSSGPSRHMGPVSVEFDGVQSGRLNFGAATDAVLVDEEPDALLLDLEEIVFTNLGSVDARPSLELIGAAPGPGSLALHEVRPVPASLAYERGNQVDSTEPVVPASSPAALGEPIDPRATATLTLGAQRAWDSGEVGRTNLYRLRTGAGSEFWLPVSASRGDLQLPADTLPGSDPGKVAGLWVGQVIFDAVTSITEDGAPARPASGSAPARIILHSDSNGGVSFLSQVTVMQRKTADLDVAPTQVLVLDSSQIPFFEGVKVRDGKRVGVRYEAVAYDMPRKLDGGAQRALIGGPAQRGDPNYLAISALPADLQAALAKPVSIRSADESDLIADSAAAIETAVGQIPGLLPDFLDSRPLRPVALAETYEPLHPLDGVIGAGKTVRTTGSKPLNLDPFHRSNPFRHAFHQKHARGPNIARQIEITFDDPDQPITDLLQGTFNETIRGLSKSDLQLSGRVELRRVSTVDSLEGS